jgi:hypothetical protein
MTNIFSNLILRINCANHRVVILSCHLHWDSSYINNLKESKRKVASVLRHHAIMVNGDDWLALLSCVKRKQLDGLQSCCPVIYNLSNLIIIIIGNNSNTTNNKCKPCYVKV